MSISLLLYCAEKGIYDYISYYALFSKKRNVQDSNGNTPVIVSAANGRLGCLSILITNQENINHRNIYSRTALMYAAKNGHLNCVKYLIYNSADVNIQDTDGVSALMYSILNQNVDIANTIISEPNCDIDLQNIHGMSSTMYVSQYGNIDLLSKMVSLNTNIELQDKFGKNALIYASYWRPLSRIGEHNLCVTCLIHSRSNINIRDKNRTTPLMYASKYGKNECVKILIDANADINVINLQNLSALNFACHSGYIDCVNLLLNSKANITHEIIPSIFCAIHSKNINIFKLLIENGAPLHSELHGSSPILCAIQYNYIECVKLLLENKVDINSTDSYGITGLMIAAEYGYFEILSLLIKNNANINSVNTFTKTALIHAVKNDRISCVKQLLRCENINIDHVTKHNKDVFEYTKSKRCKKILQIYKKNKIKENLLEILPFPVSGYHYKLHENITDFVM